MADTSHFFSSAGCDFKRLKFISLSGSAGDREGFGRLNPHQLQRISVSGILRFMPRSLAHATAIPAPVFALMLIFTESAYSQENGLTNEMLVSACEEYDSDHANMSPSGYFCLGFVSGASGIMTINCNSKLYGGLNPHERLSTGQLPSVPAGIQAYLNWAKSHPEIWGEPANNGVTYALSELFPCE